MKKIVLLSMLALSCLGLLADEVPTLAILTTSENVQIPIASIQKITYEKDDLLTMYVQTSADTQSFEIAQIVHMTLTNVPEPTALEEISASEIAADSQKILLNGVVYVIKDGKIYTLKGERVQ